MTIEEAITRYKSNAEHERTHGNLQGCLEFRQLAEWLRKYQQLQSDYETRLKADLVAMLDDLKQDFIAEAYGIEMDCTDYVVNVADIDKIIQQKINALKAERPQLLNELEKTR